MTLMYDADAIVYETDGSARLQRPTLHTSRGVKRNQQQHQASHVSDKS